MNLRTSYNYRIRKECSSALMLNYVSSGLSHPSSFTRTQFCIIILSQPQTSVSPVLVSVVFVFKLSAVLPCEGRRLLVLSDVETPFPNFLQSRPKVDYQTPQANYYPGK